jgi:hypothetical protein
MDAGPKAGQISTMLVDESFATQDDQFVDRVRTVTSPKYLAALADRWKKDPRPWAREQIHNYLALPLDRPGHHTVVKQLFKHAEAGSDHASMAAFLVAFDRLVRRRRRTRYRYDYQTSQSWQEEELFAPRDQILAPAKGREVSNPRTGEPMNVRGSLRVPRNGRLFSYSTRGYLRRRACRYFRRLGFQRPEDYCQAVATALTLFRDEDVAKGENILDNWSLMQIAFRQSPVLKFKRTRVELADGRSLGELAAAPRFMDLWKNTEAASVLLKLVTQAQSRLVRVWAIQLLKQAHASTLQTITAEQLLALLDHASEEVQQFAAGLLETLTGLDSWPISTWLRLLETRAVTALATMCDAMRQRVRPERLSLEQCVTLACARATPVARLGLSWLRDRPVTGQEDRTTIGRLAEVQCEAVGAEAATYSLSILGTSPTYRTEAVSPFFDSLNPQVRRGAWEWLTPQTQAYGDAALWSRLLETPYDDLRLRLVEELHRRTRQNAGPPALERHDLSMVWTTVLLGVHRGGRAKLTALRQISQAIAAEPDRAERLVPVLAVAIRSVRPPEARAGLSAILSAVAARPELETTLAQCIPELQLTPIGKVP